MVKFCEAEFRNYIFDKYINGYFEQHEAFALQDEKTKWEIQEMALEFFSNFELVCLLGDFLEKYNEN